LEKTYGSSNTQAATVKVKKQSSSIVAASKASFAEKYGPSNSLDTTLKKQLPQQSSTTASTSKTMSTIKKPVAGASTTKETSRRTVEGPPLKNKPARAPSLPLPPQKVPKPKKVEDPISAKVEQEEENYDEDFEVRKCRIFSNEIIICDYIL
jgi:hypothetical protein